MIPESDNDLYGWVQQMKRTRENIEIREAQRAKEPARTYRVHPEDNAAVYAEPMAQAIKRQMKGRKPRARRTR